MFQCKGQTTIMLLVVIFVVSIFLVGGFGDITKPVKTNILVTPTPISSSLNFTSPPATPTVVAQYPQKTYTHFWDQPQGSYTNPKMPAETGAKNSLQLKSLEFSSQPIQSPVSVIPSSPPAYPSGPISVPLNPDPGQPTVCGGGQDMLPNGTCCVRDGQLSPGQSCCPGVPTCQEAIQSGAANGYACQLGVSDPTRWCYGKPVIYLYPQKKMLIDVVVSAANTITQSIPHYPTGGWKNVTAYPGGALVYGGKVYNELFYEADISPVEPPKTGYIIKKSDLRNKLSDITDRLGFLKKEQDEFILYWLPRLNALPSQYVYVSLFNQTTKETVDHVDIYPKPDTFLQYMFYFRPVQGFFPVRQFDFSSLPTERRGFTAVEWGGVIDYK